MFYYRHSILVLSLFLIKPSVKSPVAAYKISGANIDVIDISAQFFGQKNADYVATLAYARSPVAEKARFLFYAGANNANNNKNKVLPELMQAVYFQCSNSSSLVLLSKIMFSQNSLSS